MKNWTISGKTKVCGVIGDPIEHTLSPVIHNTAFKELALDYVYLPFHVDKDELGKAIDGMRALKIRGLNVTIPHKVNVIPFLNELDPMAEKLGAVNTIVNDDGFLKGYNTDAAGFLQALLEERVEPGDKNIAIIGAGGASRAISFILANSGANLVILNRLEELDWATNLAANISQIFNKEVRALELTDDNLADTLGKIDIIVNATSVGMTPNINATLVPAGLIKPNMVVFDAVYNPTKTRLLREAEQAGAKTIGGINMLVWQGVLAFEMWTGQKAPVELIKQEIIKAL